MTATYNNIATKEIYKLSGVSSISKAWKMANFVCDRNNWNREMFSHDVKISVD